VTSDEPQAGPIGYLGLDERKIGVDWNAVAEHGPCVTVWIHSPAWRAGLRSGDFIRSINKISLDAFLAAPPPPGTRFEVVAWRLGFGELSVQGKLGTIPNPPKRSDWRAPLAKAGKRLEKKERPAFIHGFLADHKGLEAIDVRLVLVLLNYEGPIGIIPRRGRLARDMHCSLSTVDRAIARCKAEGILRVESGKHLRRSNTYFVTWPADHKRSKSSPE
jgi:hypothetical protein